MSDKRPIFGVVGGTDDVSQETCNLAYAVGQCIAYQGFVLLTGGRPNAAEQSVKNYAMNGAIKAGHARNDARVIGVLRGKPPEGKGIVDRDDSLPHSKCLYMHTALKDVRNVINGVTPDVVIALEGGAGTLSEIAFAHYAKTPIVFLASLESLRQNLKVLAQASKLEKILRAAEAQYPTLNNRQLIHATALTELQELLGSELAKGNCISSSADENAGGAVEKALGLINSGGKLAYNGKFPGIAGHPEIQREAEAELRKICS
jgi:uncharacterized protein (TIGR00725 family)